MLQIKNGKNIQNILNDDTSNFTIKSLDDGILRSYIITKDKKTNVRWICVQIWNGEFIFSAGVDEYGKLFRCKPRYRNYAEAISGCPTSVNRDTTFIKQLWCQLDSGIVPSGIEFYGREVCGRIEAREEEEENAKQWEKLTGVSL